MGRCLGRKKLFAIVCQGKYFMISLPKPDRLFPPFAQKTRGTKHPWKKIMANEGGEEEKYAISYKSRASQTVEGFLHAFRKSTR